MIRKLLLLVAALLLIGGTAIASPTGVSFTQDKMTAQVGEQVTYTASTGIICDRPPCRYEWKAFGPGFSRLGTPVGAGPVMVKAWSKAGNQLVQLKVTNSNGTNGFQTYQAYTVITQ